MPRSLVVVRGKPYVQNAVQEKERWPLTWRFALKATNPPELPDPVPVTDACIK